MEAFFYNPFTKLRRHLMDIAAVQVQFPGNLLIRKVQPHEIQTQNPDFKRLMVTGKNCFGKIIITSCSFFALITLSGRLFLIKTSFDNQSGFTKRTPLPFRPAQLSNSVITVNIINQILYIYLHLLASLWIGNGKRFLYHIKTPKSNKSQKELQGL